VTAVVSSGADDGFSGSWAYSSSATWYESGNPGTPYEGWYRFSTVSIPKGATITRAYLETVQAWWDLGTSLTIRAEKAGNPTAPASDADRSSRSRTAAEVAWDSGYSDWKAHPSPDIAPVIQELVDSYDYSSGAAIQLLVDNDGSAAGAEAIGLTFESGGAYAPALYIEYTAASTRTPVPNPTPAPAPTTVTFTKTVAGSADDGFAGSWGYYRGLTWYEVGNPGSPYTAWYRFTGIGIPAGATILQANLVLSQSSWRSGTQLMIRAEKAPDPYAPASTTDVARRVRTDAGVNWESGYSDWGWHNSPDITAVIQELVNSYSYTGTQAIQILVDNNGSAAGAEAAGRTFESGYAPRLYIRYSE